MASRRIPLANNPNAANSPFRGPTTSKRPRPYNADLETDPSPPKKKQFLQAHRNAPRASQEIVAEEPRGGVFAGKPSYTQPTTFQKKLAAARDPRTATQQKATEKSQKQVTADKETVQSWRKHYLRAFPSYVFYFESLSHETGPRASRQIHSLGAREEKFFSKEVTHIVTTRTIPPENRPINGKAPSARGGASTTQEARTETIDPSVLNRPADAYARSKNVLEANIQRRSQGSSYDTRQQSSNDIIHKAREMGMKIWALEKFERMVSELLTAEVAEQHDSLSRRHPTAPVIPLKRERDNDLSQLLRNEKNSAPVDRKPWQEIVPFRGYYIYIHDMEERVKPVMIRDYARTARNEDGEWPQFRSVSKGRCPFIEEPQQPRREDKEKAVEKARVAAAHVGTASMQHKSINGATDLAGQAPRTRSTTKSPQKPVLQEVTSAVNQMPKPNLPASLAKSFEPPKLQRQASTGMDNMPPMLGSAQANFRGIPRNPGGEPLASGVQQNVTSAIRSQMFSSTAPSAPGVRVGMSKQQHQMSRKVLERQSGFSANSVPSSLNANDVRAAINNDKPSIQRRNTRQRAAETMTRIHEDETLSEDDDPEADAVQKNPFIIKKKSRPVKREPKPGYCENCRDKYADFHQHIASKKHRKFALCNDNFSELDALLDVLVRR